MYQRTNSDVLLIAVTAEPIWRRVDACHSQLSASAQAQQKLAPVAAPLR